MFLNAVDFTQKFYEDSDFTLVLGSMAVVKEVRLQQVTVRATFACGKVLN